MEGHEQEYFYPPSEYEAEKMAYKKSKMKDLYTGTRLLIQEMHENFLKFQILILK
jgi:hypothetical protein